MAVKKFDNVWLRGHGSFICYGESIDDFKWLESIWSWNKSLFRGVEKGWRGSQTIASKKQCYFCPMSGYGKTLMAPKNNMQIMKWTKNRLTIEARLSNQKRLLKISKLSKIVQTVRDVLRRSEYGIIL